jgi:peptidoglycan-associated lipoprotein
MSRTGMLAAALAAIIVLAGCRSGGQIPITSGGGAAGSGAEGAGGASTQGLGAGGDIGISAQEAERQRLMDELIVYFDFDRSEIRPEFNQMLALHGEYLASNPNVTLRLEGHADETGSREYNIGLGERRAQSVRRVLMLQGATANQLSTVSYGEERPAALGSDEEAYSLNRRVELVYR